MVGQVSLAAVIFLLYLDRARGELWCYECNTDVRRGHTRECNDPYFASPYFDLTHCPRNESQHCLKAIVDYGGVLVTVRGCVPSREIGGYCQQEEYFPGSNVVCLFCKSYACNGQSTADLFILENFNVFLTILIAVACRNVARFN
ncbi:uncharacterized protein LOC108622866 [Ceratina calcarata]|uniref:Uncharacterized protein LOC108622866 n=1 Tax=Ceratina calcarata TaxID=156304 RepID=A0AAJ7W931_9HYME|nr:uncharacterized protein LOC108622866 [Ceratina calcarata]